MPFDDNTDERSLWTFNYPLGAIADQSLRNREWHKTRLSFWISEKNKVLDAIRASGIEIDGGGDDYSKFSSSYNHDTSVTIKAELKTRLREVAAKIISHRGKRDLYHSWTAIFANQDKDRILPLRHDDWTFFFGHPSTQLDSERVRLTDGE